MNIFQDLLQLSIFTCRVCSRRLQCPVLQVEAFGNICGSCNERSVFTNVTENTDVETLLSKVCVPCHYVERGCNYEGPYYKACDHEKQCGYRDRLCPFAHQNDCKEFENNLVCISDLVGHIQLDHKCNVLKAENNCISIKNPVHPQDDVLYLVDVEAKFFLLRIKFESEQDEIGNHKNFVYKFYYFNADEGLDKVQFAFLKKRENLTVKSESVVAEHESKISLSIDDHSLKINQLVLQSFNCEETISIFVNVGIRKNRNVYLYLLDSFECKQCKKYCQNEIFHCNCTIRKCKNCCNGDYCYTCRSYYNLTRLPDLDEDLKFPCRNTGCLEYSTIAEYDSHISRCQFTMYECTTIAKKSCKWQGLCNDLFSHLAQSHKDLINEKPHLSVNANGSSNTTFFPKHNSVFLCDYSVTMEGNLSFKIGVIGPEHLHNLFIWEVHVHKDSAVDKTIVTDACCGYVQAVAQNINVQKYLSNYKLNLNVYIKLR